MRPLSLLLLALEKVQIGRIVQAQNVRVEFHLLNLHGQLGLGGHWRSRLWLGLVVLKILIVLAALVVVFGPIIFAQGVLPAHQKGDRALVVLGGRAVRAALVVQSAEGDVVAGGGHQVLRQSGEVGPDLFVLAIVG